MGAVYHAAFGRDQSRLFAAGLGRNGAGGPQRLGQPGTFPAYHRAIADRDRARLLGMDKAMDGAIFGSARHFWPAADSGQWPPIPTVPVKAGLILATVLTF